MNILHFQIFPQKKNGGQQQWGWTNVKQGIPILCCFQYDVMNEDNHASSPI